MRKLQLLFLMLFAFSAFSIAQVVENFEGLSMNLFSGGSTGTVGVVANPDPTGVNTSPYVGKMLRAKDGDAWQGWYAPVKGDSVNTTTNRFGHVKVWKSRKSPICFKLENGSVANTGDIFSMSRPDTLVNQWFEVVFDYGKHAGKFGQLVLIPDFPASVGLTEDIVLYFDDMYMNNDSTIGSAPVQMLANFEPISLNIMAGGADDLSKMAVVANPHPDVVNMSSSVVEFTRDKDGVVWGGFWSALPKAVDVTVNKFVHVKVWKSRISPVKFKLEGGSDGILEIASKYPQTKTNAWEDMVFDFRAKTGTYPTIALMPDALEPVGLDADAIIYFDEIVINNDSVPVLSNDVTFNIDMTPSGLTPGQNVWISGTLGGIHGSWNEPSKNPNNQMFDADGDGIYSITIPCLPGSLMFKFFRGDNWNNGDNGPGDRPYTVTGPAVVNCMWGVKGEVTPKIYAPITRTVKAKSAIAVDGLLTDPDWATAQKYELARVFKGETIDGPADCSAFFQTLWADSGVFVAVTVTDDVLGVTPGGKYGPDWNQDLAEVYFDMNSLGLRDGKGPSASGSGHYQSADKAKDTTITSTTGIKYTYKHSGTNGNYVKELYFPFTALKDNNGIVYKPNATIPLGFDVYIADNDTSQADAGARNFRNRLIWSNTGNVNEDYANMDDAGKMVFSDAPAVFVTQETKSVKAKKAIVIDGALTEADWTTAKKYDVARVFKGEVIDGPADCSAFFQTLWADSGVFVAVTVTDDILGRTLSSTAYGPDWAQDLAEVYFDMNVMSLRDGKGVAAGAGHYASADPSRDTTITSTSGIKYTYKHSGVNGNFIKEVYFPWSALKDADGKVYTPNANVALGFDVTIADNDTSQADKARSFRNRLEWSNIGNINEDYSNMDDAGRIIFVDADATFVPQEATSVKAKKAIAIDGVLTDADWTTAKKYDVPRTYKGESISGGPTDCSAFFQTVWADTGLFVAVTVTDDVKGVTAGGKYGPDWNQDLVEVYFDMNLGNLKDGRGASYGKGHYQTARQAQDTIIKDATFLYAYKHSTKGNYVKEVYVPWKVLKDSTGALFTDNVLPIGFDVYVADNDTSQADKALSFRNRLVWSNAGAVNEDWNNMNDAGHLYISGIPTIWPTLVKDVKVNSLMFYPNPANDYIIISTSRNDLLPVSVTNITGQTVISTTVSDKGQLDVSKLDKGIYFIKLSDKDQIFTGKLIKK
jgi:hypothetical protein